MSARFSACQLCTIPAVQIFSSGNAEKVVLPEATAGSAASAAATLFGIVFTGLAPR